MTTVKELKPCPFCGSDAIITHKRYKGRLLRCSGFGYWGTTEDYRVLYWVGCNNDNCFKPKTYGDKDEAIEIWNKRVDLQSLSPSEEQEKVETIIGGGEVMEIPEQRESVKDVWNDVRITAGANETLTQQIYRAMETFASQKGITPMSEEPVYTTQQISDMLKANNVYFTKEYLDKLFKQGIK